MLGSFPILLNVHPSTHPFLIPTFSCTQGCLGSALLQKRFFTTSWASLEQSSTLCGPQSRQTPAWPLALIVQTHCSTLAQGRCRCLPSGISILFVSRHRKIPLAVPASLACSAPDLLHTTRTVPEQR